MRKPLVTCRFRLLAEGSQAADGASQFRSSRAGRNSGRYWTLLCIAFICAVAGPVAAHHSPAAFDRTKKVTLVGTVKEFRWQNPHSWIEVVVSNEKGEDVLWGVELTSPTFLVRAGWKSNTLKPGDKVTIVGNPVKSGEPSAIFVSVTLADGRTLYEQAARLSGAATRGRE